MKCNNSKDPSSSNVYIQTPVILPLRLLITTSRLLTPRSSFLSSLTGGRERGRVSGKDVLLFALTSPRDLLKVPMKPRIQRSRKGRSDHDHAKSPGMGQHSP
nr:hypothetical protein ANI_1_1970144 [Aspergillus niger CBS 513.88]|eukprot:XP_003188960.1 hypothetical protein ANI_1_1970144 [Aspergillus niger CBS 513.88]